MSIRSFVDEPIFKEDGFDIKWLFGCVWWWQLINAAASGPVLYVKILLDASNIDVVCSGDESDGGSSVSLLINACLLYASKSVLLVTDGVPFDGFECTNGTVGGNGWIGKPDWVCAILKRSFIKLNLFWCISIIRRTVYLSLLIIAFSRFSDSF